MQGANGLENAQFMLVSNAVVRRSKLFTALTKTNMGPKNEHKLFCTDFLNTPRGLGHPSTTPRDIPGISAPKKLIFVPFFLPEKIIEGKIARQECHCSSWAVKLHLRTLYASLT